MDDAEFLEKVFNPFFKDLMVCRYKLGEGLELTEKQKKSFFNLKFLIPIYQRILEDDSLEINDVMKQVENRSHKTSQGGLDGFKSEYNFDDKKDTSKKQTTEEDNIKDESDEEGDELVGKLTSNSLLKLEKVRENAWCTVRELEDITEDEVNASSSYDSYDSYSSDSAENIEDADHESSQHFEQVSLDQNSTSEKPVDPLQELVDNYGAF